MSLLLIVHIQICVCCVYIHICVYIYICSLCYVLHIQRERISIETEAESERQSRLDNHKWLSMSYLTMLDNNILNVSESLRGKASGNERNLPF